jgi:hypothetical protein
VVARETMGLSRSVEYSIALLFRCDPLIKLNTTSPDHPGGLVAFGFTASLLESIPIIGLGFSVSNRVGAAMWAFDLEKRQHGFANGELHKLRPEDTGLSGTGKVDFPSRHLQEEEIELDGLKRSPGEL